MKEKRKGRKRKKSSWGQHYKRKSIQGHFVLVLSAADQPLLEGFTALTAAVLLGLAAGQSPSKGQC